MSENLLSNGGFEEDWGVQASHDVLICKPGQLPYISQLGNVFSPCHWLTWFVHDPGPPGEPGTWDQPEVRDAWTNVDPHRVHSGEKAILLFTFWRRHHAGFCQQVQVTPGAMLSLSAYAHSWSNTNIPGHPDCTDKARCSAGAGTKAVAIPTADAAPLTGDPWEDALQNFAFCVGIDPTGGTSPLADTVQWGEAYYIYNEFYRLTAEAIAQGATATVFLRSLTQWKFKHNDSYYDDVTLIEEVKEMERGDPRIQYERTYILLPPRAGQVWARAAVDATWDEKRYTIGGSADDAGIGNLDIRRIIAINPQDWPGILVDFYDKYYPHIEYIPVQAETPEALREILARLE